MTKIEKAIAYFEDAIRESDEIISECSSALQAELTEQKEHFVVALEAMRRAQLIESQRREKAAVEDMKRIVDAVRKTHCDETCCFACKYDCDTSVTWTGDYANECPGFDRDDCFEWRGLQKAEKGENNA